MNQKSKVICPCCKSNQIHKIREYNGKSENFKDKSIVKCKNCGLVFAYPSLTDEELEIYNSSYFLNAHGGNSTHPIALAFHSAINKIRANHVLDYAKGSGIKVKKVLEIGPGLGFILKYFQNKHPEVEYSIIESDLENLSKLKKIAFSYYKDLDDAPKDYFDLVVVSHVLEHTNDPVAFTSKLIEKINRDGILFIEVPNEDYKFKNEDEPHLLFFNKFSMGKLLDQFSLKRVLITNHGPAIEEGFFNKLIIRLYHLIDSILTKFKILIPVHFFYGSHKKFLSNREIISIIPFDAIISKDYP
ncbi:MAG: methyltransferase type 12, partial [Leptospira sp.]